MMVNQSPMSTDSTLYYVHDPMCSWCYAFRPVWHAVQSQLPPSIRVKCILGGLAPDSNEVMPLETQNYVQTQWHKIIRSVPGTVFNFDFWSRCKPRRSTYIACRAVILARRQNREVEMIHAIQDAYYQQALNPSDAETLHKLAIRIGLDGKSFLDDLNAEATQAELLADINYARSIGANSFPSLFLAHGSSIKAIPHNYTDALKIIEAILAPYNSAT